jgi:NAD(P)-dependent dehydrogenase (short-subunit alcohol dehydrogenase family)
MLVSKSFLVTGSTDGIGLHVAKKLAEAGATVLVHGRTEGRVADAVKQVQHVARSPEAVTGHLADFASLAGVRELASQVRGALGPSRLSVLINNAGVYEQQHAVSGDGMEMTWAVNVAAPFLLTSLLINEVQERVVNVASISAASSIDLGNLQQEQGRYSAHAAYSLSKLGDMLITLQMAARLRWGVEGARVEGTSHLVPMHVHVDMPHTPRQHACMPTYTDRLQHHGGTCPALYAVQRVAW